MTQRQQVWSLDGPECRACGKNHCRNADSWTYQIHHVIKAQRLRREGVRPARIRDATYCCLLCRTCHLNHHARSHTIPLEALPVRVVRAVDALGPWAQDQLRREHPPTAAGRLSAPTKGTA